MNWKKRAISLLLALVFVAALLPAPQARAAAPTISCPSCGARNWEWAFADTDPSCTDPGSEYWACKDCGQEQSVSLPALGHSWSDWEPTPLGVPPSCTEGGKLLHYCSRCGTTETSDFPALGHAWDGGKVTREASCTADGSSLYTCSRCGVTETRSIAALGHAWDEGKETKEASCTEEGSADYSCERCDAKETRKLDPLGHDWEEKERTQPEGIRDGKILSVCRRCGEEKGEAIPVLAGDFFKSLRNNPSNADKAPSLRITSHPKGGVIELDSGEKLTLRVEVSGGVEPYRYAWYVSGEEAEAAARSAAMSKFSKSVSGAAGRAGRSQANIASSWLNAHINSNISDMHGQRMAAMAEAMAKGGSFSLLRDVKLSDSPLGGSDGPEYETAYGNCRYWCVVTDAAGNEAISNAARVGYHLRIAEQPQNANLQPEGKALLSCQAADGLGFYSYKWLDAQGNTVGEAQTVSVTEEGAYCCVVSDGEDSLTSEPATVYSTDPFQIVSFNRDTKKWPEENLRLSASFTGGVPPYEVWWDYEGQPLPTEQNGNDPKGNPAYRADGKAAGLYTVHATDAMGATLTRSVRRVEKELAIAEQPVGGAIPLGNYAVIDIKMAEGEEPYTYTLYLNGQEYLTAADKGPEHGFAIHEAFCQVLFGVIDAQSRRKRESAKRKGSALCVFSLRVRAAASS